MATQLLRAPLALALLGVSLAAAPIAWAQPDADRYPPDGPGRYAIGHATAVIIDSSRNPDGSVPATSAGRPLYLHFWYPTSAEVTEHVAYTWNNPVYSQNPGGAVYPGLPDLPALTFIGSTSLNPVAELARLAEGRFPLLISAHGLEVAAAKSMPDTLETLASHGYIVASVEFTGDDDAFYQTFFLETYVGLALGPNPSIHSSIAQRSRDARFAIDALLGGSVDEKAGIAFSRHIDAEAIGILGYSLGGETSLATVAGISSQGLPADRRVKAAFMGAGTNYGLVMNAADYANVSVPVMFFGNDTGIAYQNFNLFTHAMPKYLVDVAGFNHHTGGYQSSWCQDFRNSMLAVNPAVFPQAFINPATLNPNDIANFTFDSTFYFSYTGPRELGIYNFCDASAFDGISDAQLVAVLFGNPQILTARGELEPLMPLAPEIAVAETTRLTNRYAVAFFDATLRHDAESARYLTAEAAAAPSQALVHFVADCQSVPAHPFDLMAGDRITLAPHGDSGYEVSVTSGATLLDAGPTQLQLAGGQTAYLSFPGFSFPVPGQAEPIAALLVNEHGAITSRTSADYPAVDDNGSPWYMRGQLLLTNRFTIGALMKGLDSSAAAAGGGVFAYFDAANARVVVTYKGVPAAGTTQPNTLQVAIYESGRIDITIGELAPTGAGFSPSILGTLGVAAGGTKAVNLRQAKPIRFSALRDGAAQFVPFGRDGAIYEQFYQGTGASCARGEAGD